MIQRLLASFLAVLLLLIAAPVRAQPAPGDDFGLLVMAHGGGPAWNAGVEAMLAASGQDSPDPRHRRRAARDGGRAIVIPYRVAGFGPHARGLDGLRFAADRRGLLPSVEVAAWVRRQAEALRIALAPAS